MQNGENHSFQKILLYLQSTWSVMHLVERWEQQQFVKGKAGRITLWITQRRTQTSSGDQLKTPSLYPAAAACTFLVHGSVTVRETSQRRRLVFTSAASASQVTRHINWMLQFPSLKQTAATRLRFPADPCADSADGSALFHFRLALTESELLSLS